MSLCREKTGAASICPAFGPGPALGAETDCVDHCHYRFIYSEPDADLPLEEVGRLLTSIQNIGLRWINLEKLQEFDSKRGFTKAQGED